MGKSGLDLSSLQKSNYYANANIVCIFLILQTIKLLLYCGQDVTDELPSPRRSYIIPLLLEMFILSDDSVRKKDMMHPYPVEEEKL
jgi:hypothetical protein